MIIDFRVRIPSPELQTNFLKRPPTMQQYADMYKIDNPESQRLAELPVVDFLIELKKMGIERIVWPAQDNETTTGAKVPDEMVARYQALHPDQITGLAGFDPHKGMDAVRQFESAIKDLGLKGANIGPFFQELPANHRRYYPLYAKCVELNVPVVIHTSVNFAPSLALDHGRPLHLDDVAMDFPELKIIASHGGWPWVNELVALAWRHPNLYIEISGIRPKHMVKPGSGWESLLNYGQSIIKHKVLWGTDWPLLPFDRTLQEMDELGLADDVKALWMGENARRLLG